MSSGYFRRLLGLVVTTAPQMTGHRKIIATVVTCIDAGKAGSTILCLAPTQSIARYLLEVLVGVQVRVRPDHMLLEGAIASARPRLERQQGAVLRQSCFSR